AKPLVEQVEDAEQVLLGRHPALTRLGLDPVEGPATLPLLQEREHEVVLGREVVVQRRLGDAGLGHDLVDADGADSPGGEEAMGGLEQTVAWMRLNRQVCSALPVRAVAQAVRSPGSGPPVPARTRHAAAPCACRAP